MLGMARGVVGALFFYFLEAVRGFERAETSILLLVYFVAGLAGAPVWSALAVRIGKHGAPVLACTSFAVTLLLASFARPVLVPLADAAGPRRPEVPVARPMVAPGGPAFAPGAPLPPATPA